MKQLYFVRHGETEWNRAARMQGRLHSDLTELGREQAAINGRLLAEHDVECLVVSPLGRTRQTAEIIGRSLDVPVEFEERIVEWDCGDWSGHLYAEVEERWREEWQAWLDDRYGYRPPGAENWPDMIERATPFLDRLLGHEATSIGIVSHGLIGRVMMSVLLKLEPRAALELRQDNDTVFRLSQSGGPPRFRPQAVDRFVAGGGPFGGLLDPE